MRKRGNFSCVYPADCKRYETERIKHAVSSTTNTNIIAVTRATTGTAMKILGTFVIITRRLLLLLGVRYIFPRGYAQKREK